MVARVEPVAGRRAQRTWLHVFTVGLVLWVAATVVTVVTENSTLLPTVILLGSFLVPVTFVVWAYERRSAWLDEHMFLPLLRHRRRARLALVSLLGLAVLAGSCTARGCGRQGIGRPSTSVNRSPIGTPNARDSRQRPRMFMPR